LFYDLLFSPRRKSKKEKKKGNFLSYVVFSRPILTSCMGCSYAITLCIKNKNRWARKEAVRHQFRGLTVSLFFPCHKITESATAVERVIIVIAVLRWWDVRTGGRADKKKFPNRKRKIIIRRVRV
jgi:hypothetical protein